MIGGFADARFYVIGVGPGDPDLLTLKAVRMIGMADVIAYPVTPSGHSRARQTISEYITKLHKELAFDLPIEVDPAAAQQAYDGVSGQIRDHLDAGRSVALLCEGDPFFYGSAIHVFGRLADHHKIRIVPGISSLTAGAAAAGLPLAVREDVLKVLPATLDYERLEAELDACESAVIIKVGRHFGKVAEAIRTRGLGARAVMVSAVSHEEQRVVRFEDLNSEDQPYFSIVLISRHGRTTL